MSDDYGDKDYKCSLSGDVWKKAQKELKEDANTRLVEVKSLRKRLEKVPGLKANLSFSFLLAFLRARKFDQERTFQLVKNHYETKRDNPDIFEDIKPSRIRHVLDDNILEVLDQRDNEGCKVVIFRAGAWDPDRYPQADIVKMLFLVLTTLVEDEETQVNGIHFMENFEGMTMRHATSIDPGMSKKMVTIVQDCVPLRMKRVDMINEPTFFDIFFSIVKQFMKKKLLQRINLHGPKLEKVMSTMNTEHLPSDFGGKQAPNHSRVLIDHLLTLDSKFETENKFGFVNMAVNSEEGVTKTGDVSMEGLGGTFKKLDI